jgi:hypothetical protein
MFIGEAEVGHLALASAHIENCRRVGIDPYAYLRDLLAKIRTPTNRQLKYPAGLRQVAQISTTPRSIIAVVPLCYDGYDSNLRQEMLGVTLTLMHRMPGNRAQ